MSLHQLAQQIQSHGRGNDSQLVHMTPNEVRAMRNLAHRHGGDLSVNPNTGLPEAGFLERLLPTVIGAGVGIATGNPMIGAAVGGGLGMAANKGSIQAGLMAGLGAYGMGSLGSGLMATGAEALATSPEAMVGALGVEGAATGAGSQAAMLAQQNAGLGMEGLESVRSAAGTAAGATPAAAPSTFDQLQSGFKNTAFNADFLKKNMFPIGMAAAPLLLASQSGKPKEEDEQTPSYIRPYTFEQTPNPEYTGAGTRAFNQRYIAHAPILAKDYGSTYMAGGGIVALADGGISGYSALGFGEPQDFRVAPLVPAQTNTYAPNIRPVAPEVTAYNTQMMQRANQQYNINPALAPMQVAGFDKPAAPKKSEVSETTQTPEGPKDYIDDYYQQMLGRNADAEGRKLIENAIGKSWYDPARDIPDVIRKSAEFQKSGKNPNPTGIEIGKVYSGNASPSQGGFTGAPGSVYAKLLAEKQKKEAAATAVQTDAPYVNDLGGAANGGLMQAYAMGGDIGTRYQSPDDIGGMGDKVGAHQTVNMAPHYPMQGLYQGYAGGGISSLGGYSDGGRLLRGPGDGVSDDIPAQIGARQPARLADGEFVVPARIVSELGNGSTDAGAKRLYAMMDRVQNARKKSVGKNKVAVDSKARRHLPA